MSYGEEDTCMEYEEEDTWMSSELLYACHLRRRIHACMYVLRVIPGLRHTPYVT